MRAAVGAALALLLALGGAAARAECLEDMFTQGTPRAAKLGTGAAPRANFLRGAGEGPGCPDASAACRKRAFVMPGDVVLLAGEEGGYACAAFTDPKGVTSLGLLPRNVLEPVAEPREPRPAEDWTGTWVRVEATVVIRPATAPGAAAGARAVRGIATWGGGDPVRVRNGGVHTGEVEGTAAPDDAGVLAFTEGAGHTVRYDPGDTTSCSIHMLRRGPYLLVTDNSGCGGMNVRFDGIYRRR